MLRFNVLQFSGQMKLIENEQDRSSSLVDFLRRLNTICELGAGRDVQ
jgi:hypothetical protein